MSDIPPETLTIEEARLTLNVGAQLGKELVDTLEEDNISLSQSLATLGYAFAWLMHITPDQADKQRCMELLFNTFNSYTKHFEGQVQ